jgi:hypothetical protein
MDSVGSGYDPKAGFVSLRGRAFLSWIRFSSDTLRHGDNQIMALCPWPPFQRTTAGLNAHWFLLNEAWRLLARQSTYNSSSRIPSTETDKALLSKRTHLKAAWNAGQVLAERNGRLLYSTHDNPAFITAVMELSRMQEGKLHVLTSVQVASERSVSCFGRSTHDTFIAGC